MISSHPASIVQLGKHLKPGQHKRKCPECHHTRRKHTNDRSLSLVVDSLGVKFHCHHCLVDGGWIHEQANHSGTSFPMASTGPAISLRTPTPGVKEIACAYLVGRGIDPEVVNEYTVQGTYRFNGTSTAAIGFPYQSKGDVVAIKWRSADDDKMFSQQQVCRDFFLLDRYSPGNDVLICEGEVDALAWLTAGLPDDVSVLSVPNGAPAKVREDKVDPKDDNKFAYLYRAKEALDTAERIYLNVDNDGPGRALADEVLRRTDRAKIWTTTFDGYKDAAEALKAEGPMCLTNAFEHSTPVPMVGLHTAADFADPLHDLYENGLTKGLSTGLVGLDDLMTVVPGMMTIITGFPGSGKSDLVDQICLNLARDHGWKTVFCSFEKPVPLHMAQLSEKLIGAPFFDGATRRMTDADKDWSVDWLNDHFMFIDHADGGPTDVEGILETASAAVMRMGCRVLVIDPYNYITVDRSIKETDVISDMLTSVQRWAKKHEAHVFFVAHPHMIGRERLGKKVVVTGHDIAKSAAWFAKADVGLTVWRDPEGKVPSEAHVWKQKWMWTGRCGFVPLTFDPITSRWGDDVVVARALDTFDWDSGW